jgi:hypothetical protein
LSIRSLRLESVSWPLSLPYGRYGLNLGIYLCIAPKSSDYADELRDPLQHFGPHRQSCPVRGLGS